MKQRTMKEELRKYYITRIIIFAVLIVLLFCGYLYALSKDLLSKSSLQFIWIGLTVIMVAIGIIKPLISILTNSGHKKIEEAEERYGLPDEEVVKEYLTADKYNGLMLSNHFAFISQRMQLIILPLYDIVWVYMRETKTQTGGKTTYSLVIKTINKREYSIGFHNTSLMNKCVEDLSHQPHILIGYSEEYDKLYKRSMKEFLNLRYNSKD